MVSTEAVLSARVDAGHESSDGKIGSKFAARRQTGYSDRNITNMSTFSKYEYLQLSHRLIVMLKDQTAAIVVLCMPMDPVFTVLSKTISRTFEVISSQLID